MDINTINNAAAAVRPSQQRLENSAERARAEISMATESTQRSSELDSYRVAKQAQATGGSADAERFDASPSSRMIDAALEVANMHLAAVNRNLNVSIHEETNRMMVEVVNSETGDVIREVPPEKMLDIFAKALEFAGILFDESY